MSKNIPKGYYEKERYDFEPNDGTFGLLLFLVGFASAFIINLQYNTFVNGFFGLILGLGFFVLLYFFFSDTWKKRTYLVKD